MINLNKIIKLKKIRIFRKVHFKIKLKVIKGLKKIQKVKIIKLKKISRAIHKKNKKIKLNKNIMKIIWVYLNNNLILKMASMIK